jgi:hypothetical protein
MLAAASAGSARWPRIAAARTATTTTQKGEGISTRGMRVGRGLRDCVRTADEQLVAVAATTSYYDVTFDAHVKQNL